MLGVCSSLDHTGLRTLLAAQGLVPGVPAAWPANISFEQVLSEVGGGVPVNGSGGFVVNVGAGDGRRMDIYHKPMDPTWPLFEFGFGGLAVEANPHFDHRVPTTPGAADPEDYGPPMTYASGKLSSTLAEVNRSGTIQIAWTAARPETIAQLLRAHGTPASFDALSIDIDSDEVALVRAILEGGFSPRAIAVNFNPDLPPPIYLESHLGGEDRQPRADAGRHLPGSYVSAGLGSGSAAAFYEVLSPKYSLLGFQMGRFSRWCHRCEQRMWWVRMCG